MARLFSLHVLVLTAFIASVLSGSIKTANLDKNGEVVHPYIEDDNFLYFYDITTRNHSASSAYCQSASLNGELAIITGPTIAERLRLGSEFPPAGNYYWINGMEFPGLDKFSNIDVKCEDHRQLWSLNGVEVTVPVNYCLALYKHATVTSSRFQAMDCSTANAVLCSIPLNTCRNPVTTTTPPPTGSTDSTSRTTP